MTAAELMRGLEADPEWVARRDANEAGLEAISQECERDQIELVNEIRAVGIDIDCAWDLVNNQPHPVLKRRFVGPYQAAYPILIRHLYVQHHPRVREGIVRALTVKDGGPDLEAALFDQFYAEPDHTLRWALANALRAAVPYRRRKPHPEIASILHTDTVIADKGETAPPNS